MTPFEELPPAREIPIGDGQILWEASFLAAIPAGTSVSTRVKAVLNQDKVSELRLKQEQRGHLMVGMLVDVRGMVYGISSVYVGGPPETTDGPQPTAEQCSTNAEIHDADGRLLGYACWYPQTGGYWGRALAKIDPCRDPDSCIDVLVWHDGQFPFDGECQNCREPRQPVALHHCDGEQFVEFGQFLMGLESTPEVEVGRDD